MAMIMKVNGRLIKDVAGNINNKIKSVNAGANEFRGYIYIEYDPKEVLATIPENVHPVFTYEHALELRNDIVYPMLEQLAGGIIGAMPNRENDVYSLAAGGDKKKFFPDHGVVIAGNKKTAEGDYKREDGVSGWLGSNSNTYSHYNSDKDLGYVSFQKEIIDDAENEENLKAFVDNEGNKGNKNIRGLQLKQVRRVSLYGSYKDRLAREDLQYHTTLDKFIIPVVYPDSTWDDHKPTEVELVSCVHQIIKIHEYLYLNKITHGDMHMGNIKVIRNKDGVLLKAFDFGKANKINNKIYRKMDAKNYTRADLKYLLEKKAVSGFYETIKRNTIRSQNDTRQLKHYPLHKVCMALSFRYFNVKEKDRYNGDEKKKYNASNFVDVEYEIGQYSKEFLSNLEMIRKSKLCTRDMQLAIKGMFSVFSNQIVSGALYGFSSGLNKKKEFG